MSLAKSILIGSGRLIAFTCVTALLIPYYLPVMCIYVVLGAGGDNEGAEKVFEYGFKVMDFTAAKCGLDG